MRSIDPGTLTALSRGSIILRHFLWITPRDLTTGAQASPVGLWNDVGARVVNAIDGTTGATVARTYQGSGKIAGVDQLVMEVGIAVRTCGVTLNILDPAVEQLVRGFELRKAPVEWHFGLMDTESRNLVAAIIPLFVGFINTSRIMTPNENGEAGSSLELVSETRRLTKRSGDKRSDESQRRRSPSDDFFRYAEAMRSREVFWGMRKAGVQTGTAGIPGRGAQTQ